MQGICDTAIGGTGSAAATVHTFQAAIRVRLAADATNEDLRMKSLDWSQCPAVENIPGKVSGVWVFKDIVFENYDAEAMIDEIMDGFHLTREQIASVLTFAARGLDPPPAAQSNLSTVDALPV
jgi:hypothetical protein